MNPARQEIWQTVIGAIVVCVVLGVVGLVFGAKRIVDDGRYEVRAVFGKVDGLSVGGEVLAAGIPVGEVIELKLTDGYRAIAVLRVDRDVVLDVESSAAIVTDGLFGNKYVRLDIGGAVETIGDGGQLVFTEEPVIIDELLEQIIHIGEARIRERSGR